MIGIRESIVNTPVYSRNIIYDIPTVNIGAELFIVSVNDTATYFKATSPNTTVANLSIEKNVLSAYIDN
jgi:hypothetical protein